MSDGELGESAAAPVSAPPALAPNLSTPKPPPPMTPKAFAAAAVFLLGALVGGAYWQRHAPAANLDPLAAYAMLAVAAAAATLAGLWVAVDRGYRRAARGLSSKQTSTEYHAVLW